MHGSASKIAVADLSPAAAKAPSAASTEIDDALGPDAYWRAKTWKRVAVIFAGPGANLLLAIVLFAGLFLATASAYRLGFVLGADGNAATALVEEVVDDTPAASSGLRAGDRIVAIDGRPVDAGGIRDTISGSAGRR